MNISKLKIASAVICCTFLVFEAISFNYQGFGESTGAPLPSGTFTFLDTYSGCEVTGCHTGNELNDPAGSLKLTTDIPNSGWEPATTYNLAVTMQYPGKDVFGFKITSWGDLDSTSVGSFSLTDTTAQLTSATVFSFNNDSVGSFKYVTHKGGAGIVSSEGGQKTWRFRWTSPSTQAENVTFYIAGNASNGNGQTSGDFIYYTQKRIGNGDPIAVTEIDTRAINLAVYPNPAASNLFVKVDELNLNSVQTNIYNLAGQLLHQQDWKLTGFERQIDLDVSLLTAGVYMLQLNSSEGSSTTRFIKQ